MGRNSKTPEKGAGGGDGGSVKKDKKPHVKRGVGMHVEVKHPAPPSEDEVLKRFGPLNLESKQAQTAIVLLESEEIPVIIDALNSLQKFCKKRLENRVIFADLGGTESIWKYLHHKNQIIQRLALKLLAIVSVVHKVKVIVRDHDFTIKLLPLLKSDDDVLVEYISVITLNLATLFTGRIQILQSNGSTLLISLLHHPDPDIVKNSLEAIFNILYEPLHNEFFECPEGIKPLFALVDSEYPTIQTIALSVLEKLTKKLSGVVAVSKIRENVLDNLQKKIGNEELGDIHRLCLRVLINLAGHNLEVCKRLSSYLTTFNLILESSKDAKVLSLTLTLIGKISVLPLNVKSLIEHDFPHQIISIVEKYDDVEMREAAVETASQMSSIDIHAKQAFINLLRPLKSLFKDCTGTGAHAKVETKVIDKIIQCMCIISEGGREASSCFFDSGCLDIITLIIKTHGSFTTNSLISALSALTQISSHVELIGDLVDTGGLLPALIHLLSHEDPKVISNAAPSIAALLSKEGGREIFINEDGCNALIQATKNPELNVVVSLIGLIHSIGTYPKLAQKAINSGILSALWERRDILNRNGPLRTCMDRMLSTHLPAKYSFNGSIGYFEKLPHCFYDSGPLGKYEIFTPLNLINMENRVHHQRIIFLNLTSDSIPQEIIDLNPIMKKLIGAQRAYHCIGDYIGDLRKLAIENVRSEKDLVGLIGTFVAKKLGGVVDKWRVSTQTEDLELADLQSKYNSPAVPLTALNNGAYRSRALLFKALSDAFGIPCGLERVGMKKCWNVVLIHAKVTQSCHCPETEEEEQSIVFTEKLKPFVVDLMYSPGSIFPANSYEAETYCSA